MIIITKCLFVVSGHILCIPLEYPAGTFNWDTQRWLYFSNFLPPPSVNLISRHFSGAGLSLIQKKIKACTNVPYPAVWDVRIFKHLLVCTAHCRHRAACDLRQYKAQRTTCSLMLGPFPLLLWDSWVPRTLASKVTSASIYLSSLQ